MGRSPITSEAIQHFATMRGLLITPFEVEAIRAMDDAVLALAGTETADDAPKPPSRPMTPALFGALFGS